MASRSTTSAHRRRAVAVNENSLRTQRDGSINVICTRLPLNDHAPGHLSGRRPHRPVRNPAVTIPTGIKIEADGGVDTFKMDFIRSPSHSRSTPPQRAAATGPTRVGGRRATSPKAWLIARRRSTGPRRGESFGAQHGHPPRRGPQNARSPTIRSYRPCCPKLRAGIGARSPLAVRMAQALLQRASLLAPDLIPLNYLIAATPESMLLQLVAFRTPWWQKAHSGVGTSPSFVPSR